MSSIVELKKQGKAILNRLAINLRVHEKNGKEPCVESCPDKKDFDLAKVIPHH